MTNTEDPLSLIPAVEKVDLSMALDTAIRKYRDSRKSCIRLGMYIDSAYYYSRIERYKALNQRLGFDNPTD